MRTCIFSTVFALLVLSCPEGSHLDAWGAEFLSSDSVYPPGSIDASDFFPLEVGNSWTYDYRHIRHTRFDTTRSVTTRSVTTRIVGTTMIEGEEYFLLKGYFSGWPENPPLWSPADSVLFRLEEEKVYWYLDGAEYLYYDFSASVGGDAHPHPSENSWSVPILTSSGTSSTDRCKSFETRDCAIFTVAMTWAGDYIQESFTRGIGRTYLSLQVGDWSDVILREAVIGGQRYTPPFVDPERYFPLRVGARWTYRKVGDIAGPETVTTRVVGTTTIYGREYFLVKDDLIKQKLEVLPDTLLLRKEGSRIYLFLDDREHLLYEFSMPDSPRAALLAQTRELSSYSLSSGAGCALFYFCDSLPSCWIELFAPGIGKIQIFEVNGGLMWELQEVMFGDGTSMENATWGRVKSGFR